MHLKILFSQNNTLSSNNLTRIINNLTRRMIYTKKKKKTMPSSNHVHAYRNRKSGGKDWNRSIIAITPVRRSVISKRARFAVVLLSRFLTGQSAPPTVRAVDVTPVSRCIGRWIHNSYRLQYERPRNVSAPLCHRHVSQRSIISNTTDYFGSISFQGISIIPRNYSIIIIVSRKRLNDLFKKN